MRERWTNAAILLVEAEANRLQSRPKRGRSRQHALDLRSRAAGIAETEQRDADDPVTQQQIRRIGLFLGSGAELAREREAFSIFADPHLIGIKSAVEPLMC